jgi:hypothetical protein
MGMTIKQGTKRVMEVAAKLPPLVDERLRPGRVRSSTPLPPIASAGAAAGIAATR